MSRAIGTALAIISAGCTAHWLWGLSLAAMGTLGAGVTAASGLLLEGAKFSLRPTGWLVKLALSLLMLLSMTSTYFYLESTLKHATVDAATIERLQGQITAIDWQIDQVQSNVEELASRVYITKSRQHMADLKELREERLRLSEELTELNKVRISPEMERFSWLIFIVVAVLVDLVAFLCLSERVPTGSDVQEIDSKGTITPKVFDLEEVKLEIAQGKLPPKVSAIREKYGCRHEKAAHVLECLVSSGILEVSGGKRKSYRFAQHGKVVRLQK